MKRSSFIKFTLILLTCLSFLVSCDQYHGTGHSKFNKNRAVVDDAAYWNKFGQQLLQDELAKQRFNVKAKNVIIFLGDGMSIPTVTAARIYKGQKKGQTGEEENLTFDKFPYGALSRTYCSDSQVADSACSGTAYLTGVKTNIDTLGIDANVVFNDCSTQNVPAYKVPSTMTWAQAAGKGTGIVTTTRITHATPAATYAHVANRDWEDDSQVVASGADPLACDDIAEQLVLDTTGNGFKVILGGGRAYLTPETELDPETGKKGNRLDRKNLINTWKTNHPTGSYVYTRDELLALNLAQTDSLLGLFAPDHMDFFLESGASNDPSLEDMTRAAISMLQKEANGFVLLVEGGMIDQGHHAGRAKIALEEALQFDMAISAAVNMTDPSETLIIVTADHAHTMTITGYPVRGNPLLGLVGGLALDRKPYTTLSYSNGPGYDTNWSNGVRPDLTNVDTASDSFLQPASVPLSRETHGGDDVAIFALGPQAHLFQNVYEQHYIAHVIGYAACISPGLHFCTVA